uniref:Gag-Pol polyprotein n=1 Tax=Tanacetum cinerariifolium TaxID=118510 RepID=A0A6L2K2N3_TANCI|nr:Gag-Pol polyprotein [Tanacetum cinerariifolium]
MKEKGDPCILMGYSTQSKGYKVYNKRTRLIVESIHINLDEIKELPKASDYDDSGPSPPRQNLSSERTDMTFEHNSSSLRIHNHNNEPSSLTLDPNVSPLADINAPSLQELEFQFNPLFKEYFTAGNQNLEMCMFALTVSTAEPKNIKEAMADSAWIKAMQDEIHQFDRIQVWELVNKPFGKKVIKLKWLWKNKKDEDQIVIRNKA